MVSGLLWRDRLPSAAHAEKTPAALYSVNGRLPLFLRQPLSSNSLKCLKTCALERARPPASFVLAARLTISPAVHALFS